MKLFEKLFRPRPPIRDREALADFIDAQSAFIVQKGIYEYSRARAGHYAKVLFAEKEFAQSVEYARWQAYPLGLSMVGEMIEGVLASQARNAAPGNSRPADSGRSFGVRPLSRSSIDRGGGLACSARRSGASARSGWRPCAQAGDGYSRTAGRNLFRDDADPRKAARPGFSDHAQLSARLPLQYPRRIDLAHGRSAVQRTLLGDADI